ncbi:glycoside hydrolase family 27 protein [Sphingomonas crusticola]|uniref:glycoside hydrolase family 27 protein n=1 Tax=Sphingomonas crusticola TaxID=1697973 RepID=UPI00196889DD|nr:glycoside hydrolase family 27 protein [Sphingomonas crusticola]
MMPKVTGRLFSWLLALALLHPAAASAAGAKATGGRAAALAPRPPMGWNSWDAYGLAITESDFRANVDVLAKSLKPFGWNYAVIDEGWFMQNPQDRPTPEKLVYVLDANGRYIPDPARFPSALADGRNQGFAAIGAAVHARGLKFGIHIVRGIPRESVARNFPVAGSRFRAQDVADTSDACPWDPTNWGVKDSPAGQAWYESLIAQYAQWGVDYLKVDCISDHPYKPAEIRMIHRAIAKVGRPIVLSLSPGPTSPGILSEIRPHAQMWRISDDVWDMWSNRAAWPRALKEHFDLVSGWAPLAGPDGWADADMLPIGYLGPTPGYGEPRHTRLTAAEQRTMITLWAIARSPLILGANLTRLDPATLALLTNRTVLDMNQYGRDPRQVTREGPFAVWTSTGRNGTRYLALFNLGDDPAAVRHSYDFYNLAKSYRTRDVWAYTDLGRRDGVDFTIAPHATLLLELTP